MTKPQIMVPGVGAGILLGAPEAPEKTPDQLLREREVTKLDFPSWVFEQETPPTISPLVAYFARALVRQELGPGVEELPTLRRSFSRLENTRGADNRKHSGRELKRLLLLGDYVLRKFLPAAMSCAGGSPAARMLRQHHPVKVAVDVSNGLQTLEALVRVTSNGVNVEEPDQAEFLLLNALSFAALYFRVLTDLLRTFQESLLAPKAPAPEGGVGYTVSTTPQAADAAPNAPQGDVVDVTGSMVLDLVNYAFSVYGAAHVLSADTLGGKGTQQDVDRLGVSCLCDLAAVA